MPSPPRLNLPGLAFIRSIGGGLTFVFIQPNWRPKHVAQTNLRCFIVEQLAAF